MAPGVTFPENEDVVAFERKSEMLVLLVSKLGIYKQELGNYAGYWLRKMYRKDLHHRGMQISRNALTHVKGYFYFAGRSWGRTLPLFHAKKIPLMQPKMEQGGCMRVGLVEG